MTLSSLTNGVDVEEAYRRSQDGIKHAVVETLSSFHQHREQEDVPHEAKQDGGCSETCRKPAGDSDQQEANSDKTGQTACEAGYLHKHPGRNLNPTLCWFHLQPCCH